MEDKTILQSHINDLIVQTSTKQLSCSAEDMQIALEYVLRSLQASLSNNHDYEYIQIKLYAAYNLLTGKTLLPS
ncbi:hypothetical protein [Ectobacillus polymachus]|uniref:hypothetical protein n=1 Tax=Ectobacillus polymachus TaxID=1508806 RepID=UPI003A844044